MPVQEAPAACSQEEKIKGRFRKALQQDFYTGCMEFLVAPASRHPLQDGTGLILCRGRIPPYENGAPLYLEGAREGMVFVVSSCVVQADGVENTEQLLHFLAKDLSDCQVNAIASVMLGDPFSFVGRKDCREKLLDVLRASPRREQLADLVIQNIGRIKAQESLFNRLAELRIPYQVAWPLANAGVTKKELDASPYRHLMKYGAGLAEADRYACMECRFSPYSVQRLCAYVGDTLQRSLTAGNTCVPFEYLEFKTNQRLEANTETGEAGMPAALLCGILSWMTECCSIRTVGGKDYVYANHAWDEETAVVHHLSRLYHDRRPVACRPDIPAVEQALGIRYNAGQKEAFRMLSTSGIKILTGPPGSGKTAIIRGLIRAFQDDGCGKVALAATTGMAAKVMTSACGMTGGKGAATTLHLMLHIRPGTEGSIISRPLSDPVDADFLIVDEASMMDLQMFSALLRATKNGTILLLVGDKDQLQSVGYGDILADLIRSGKVETYRLTEILRQNGATIITNAAKINRGDTGLVYDGSFRVIRCRSDLEAKRRVREELEMQKDSRYVLLSPFREKGELSVNSLNRLAQDLNPKIDRGHFFAYGGKHFHVDDPVIMLKNEYGKGYVNGETGTIYGFSDREAYVVTGFHWLTLDRADFKQMDLAYAVTIHKSQGSEYDTVYIVLPEHSGRMLTRRLLYTAVTRAKNRVAIFSVGDALEEAVENRREKKRVSLLAERIGEKIGS